MNHIAEKLNENAKLLEGKKCWSITAGESTGTVIFLQIGTPKKRAAPLVSPSLSEQEREYDGEYRIYVESYWRIDSSGSVVIGCLDESDGYKVGGPTLAALDSITNHEITRVDLQLPGCDLFLKFKNGRSLKIFCLEPNNSESGANNVENYHFVTPNGTFSVQHGSQLTFEKP